MEKETIDKEFLSMIQQNEKIIYKVASFYADADNPIADLYQEVIINVWKGYPTFKGDSKPSTWIYRIALNTCISFFRRRKVSTSYLEILPELGEQIDHNDDQLQELYVMINRLGRLERALVLLYLEDKSYKEMAEIMGMTVTNVATKLNRIKDKLRKMSDDKSNQ